MWTEKVKKSHSLQFGLKVLIIFLLASLTFATSKATEWKLDDARKAADSLASSFRASEIEPMELDSSAELRDYLRYAALSSSSLKAAFHDWKAALEKAGYAGAMPDPMLSYGYFIENVETRVGPQEHRFSLKQSFPWFGALGVKRDIAWEAANSAYNRYQSRKLRLFYQVKAAYFSLYYLGREIALTRENMELLSFWESSGPESR
jgi:outer membrane protein TolC